MVGGGLGRGALIRDEGRGADRGRMKVRDVGGMRERIRVEKCGTEWR